MDFGAVGNNHADATSKFQACIDAARKGSPLSEIGTPRGGRSVVRPKFTAGWGRGVRVGPPVFIEWADRVGSGLVRNRCRRADSSRDQMATIAEQHGAEAPETLGLMVKQPIIRVCPQIGLDLLDGSRKIPPLGSDHESVMRARRTDLRCESSLQPPTAQ